MPGIPTVFIEYVEISWTPMKVRLHNELPAEICDWYNKNMGNFNSNLTFYRVLIFFLTFFQEPFMKCCRMFLGGSSVSSRHVHSYHPTTYSLWRLLMTCLTIE